ncbi:LysR substrate-binding domain-containing protein [Ancylobacter sp. 6x-1]|uniref:LysR substrate-binding domain-containing protein n=1 Tax=Ancylobacter crimeensis TaxID=2579147 RepID=A0ABT0DBY5_9HYPH|nr:LysR family transcriptional regulator [Ancylobacter crimeensis]MCK0197459.1 LysR substrate-binding domain-containing protein [Ancylobacter crimeensis]
MIDVDLNLLRALDALLRERSVTGAARRVGLSTSAMSRTLSRLRSTIGDPLLVPAGRDMVATPHAEAIADEVHRLAAAVSEVLSPPPALDLGRVQRDVAIRANDAFVLLHAARLSAAISATAPGLRLRFVPKPDKNIQALRDADVDLDIGVVGGEAAELRGRILFRDRFVGAVRRGHALLGPDPVAVGDYAACEHVVASRHARFTGPVDEALALLGLTRMVRLVVPTYQAVLAVVAASDLVGLVPRSFCGPAPDDRIALFDLPVATPSIAVALTWHPRMDADPLHQWLRATIFRLFRA